MELTARQYRALCAICDAFLPAAFGWPSAVERGVPDALAVALDFNPREIDRWEFLNLLDFWDSSLYALLELGSSRRFSELGQYEKTKVLLRWADSGINMCGDCSNWRCVAESQ